MCVHCTSKKHRGPPDSRTINDSKFLDELNTVVASYNSYSVSPREFLSNEIDAHCSPFKESQLVKTPLSRYTKEMTRTSSVNTDYETLTPNSNTQSSSNSHDGNLIFNAVNKINFQHQVKKQE